MNCRAARAQSQSDYFAIPTCTYHGFVVYLPTGVLRDNSTKAGIEYRDNYADDKQKDACMLMHAFILLWAENPDLFANVTHVHFWVWLAPTRAYQFGVVLL